MHAVCHNFNLFDEERGNKFNKEIKVIFLVVLVVEREIIQLKSFERANQGLHNKGQLILDLQLHFHIYCETLKITCVMDNFISSMGEFNGKSDKVGEPYLTYQQCDISSPKELSVMGYWRTEKDDPH
jgi:hypothetical protein